VSNENQIVWDKDYLLTWDDFCGEPDNKNPHKAQSNIAIRCKFGLEFVKTKTKFKFTLNNTIPYAGFDRTKSWVKPEMSDLKYEGSRKLLKHEQVHFDAAQDLVQRVYSKKLVDLVGKKFSTSGKSTEEIEVNGKKEAARIISKILQNANHELIRFQDQYDKETKHGIVSQVQERYESRFVSLRS